MKYFRFEDAVLLLAKGQDVERYLNVRLTNNIARLRPGRGCLAAALTPQGKTQALFSVYRLAERVFLLATDRVPDPSQVLHAVTKYIVADRVSVQDLTSDCVMYHVLNSPALPQLGGFLGIDELPREPFAFKRHKDAVVSFHKRSEEEGFDILLRKSGRGWLEGEMARLGLIRGSDSEYKVLRARAGIPDFPSEINEEFSFLESGMREALCEHKGCYIGQEMIEKTQSKGKLPFLLREVVLPSPRKFEKGVPVSSLDNEGRRINLGEIVSATPDHERNCTYAFARLRNRENLDETEMQISGMPASFSLTSPPAAGASL